MKTAANTRPRDQADQTNEPTSASGDRDTSAADDGWRLASTPEGGSGRRITPGKGPEPSSTFSDPAAAQRFGAGSANGPASTALLASTAANSASSSTAATTLGTTAPAATPQPGIVKVGGEAPGTFRATATTAKPGVSGFRTYNAQAMELEAKTRDSMFKQIALKLLPNGGQLRMRLDPPHLGNLDVNMVVEKGSVVSLSLAAERTDVASMLDRTIPELKQLLRDHGLSLENAKVSTHEFGSKDSDSNAPGHSPEHESGPGESESPADANTALSTELGTSYITAEGLDFWV